MSDLKCIVCGDSRNLRGVNLSRGDFVLCSFCRDEMERPTSLRLRAALRDLAVAYDDLRERGEGCSRLADENAGLRARVTDLEEKYCNHNVTAILTADGNNRLR